MFDYQAGQKYRMTLIMVGLAGLMAGIFFTLLLMPTPEPTHSRPRQKWMSDPDVTGGGQRISGARQSDSRYPNEGYASDTTAGSAQAAGATTDPNSAKAFIEQWLPIAWDLSAGSARGNQEKAIAYMSPEVAAAYRQNVWTSEIEKQIDESGVKSSFKPIQILAGHPQADGAVVVFVTGIQTLAVPEKGSSVRNVHLEYLVRLSKDGMRIVGISEGGQKS
jgi:hypothetical protein